jgi:choice-of-anchor B domain-containing protein
MNKYLTLFTLLFAFFLTPKTQAQVDFNLELLMQVEYDENCNDIWGYVDENGDEYAILGTTKATAIIALDGPDAPREIAYIPGTMSTWRDMKHFQDHLYVTTDVGEDGLLIIDMSEASQDSVDHFFWKPTLDLEGRNLGPLNKCHNIYVDADEGYMYLSGCNIYNGGILIFDLNQNLEEPVLVGAGHEVYSHDVYVNDNLMFGNDIYNGELSIQDVSDKSNVDLVALQQTTGNFTHNAWSSTNNDYVFTTDEIAGGFVDAYDIRDLGNIQRTDIWQPENALEEGIIPHNAHYHEGFLFVSWYTVGLVVLDVTDPTNMVPAAWYDTYDGNQMGFNGAWGAYPFLPSGRILVSDINTGLYVFEPNIQPVARIEGTVTDIITEQVLSNVDISIEDTLSTSASTNTQGEYKTGTAKYDQVVIQFQRTNYLTHRDTLDLVPGETLILDVELIPDFQLFNWNLTVVDSTSLNPISGATIRLQDSVNEENFIYETQITGNLQQPLIPEGEYNLFYGKWGWKENWEPQFNINEDRADVLFLSKGYRDFFNLDFGWTTMNSSPTGLWERVVPQGTEIEGSISNPNRSSNNDFGDMAFVTGNDSRNAGFDDVDGGDVSLISPWMDFSNWDDVSISFDYWFFNAGGNTELNDSLRVSIQTPDEEKHIQTFTNSASEWRTFGFAFDSLEFNRRDSVRMVFVASDYEAGGGHIVEAGVDAFDVEGQLLVSSIQPVIQDVSIYPNPTTHQLYISNASELLLEANHSKWMIYDMSGRLVHNGNLKSNALNVSSLTSGTYVLLIKSGNQLSRSVFQVIR